MIEWYDTMVCVAAATRSVYSLGLVLLWPVFAQVSPRVKRLLTT